MIGQTARFLWLRWLLALMFCLQWTTMGNAAAQVERSHFAHSTLAAKSAYPHALTDDAAVQPSLSSAVHTVKFRIFLLLLLGWIFQSVSQEVWLHIGSNNLSMVRDGKGLSKLKTISTFITGRTAHQTATTSMNRHEQN